MTEKIDELLYSNKNKKCFLERKTKISKKDKKFYRKRILNLTRELFLSSDVCNMDVNEAFMNYVYHCIEHFKNTDTNDILQCEYMGLYGGENEDLEVDDFGCDADCDTGCDADVDTDDSLIIRKIVKPNTLDNFIIRNVIKKNQAEYLPIQKEINLKDPQLRVKGIALGKKKNLMNTYEEDEDGEKENGENENGKKEDEPEHRETASVEASVEASVSGY